MRPVRSGVIVLMVTVAGFVCAPVAVGRRAELLHDYDEFGGVIEDDITDLWANGVCTSVQTWLDSVNSTIKGLKGAGSLDAATTQARRG